MGPPADLEREKLADQKEARDAELAFRARQLDLDAEIKRRELAVQEGQLAIQQQQLELQRALNPNQAEQLAQQKQQWADQKALREAQAEFERSIWKKVAAVSAIVGAIPTAAAAIVAALFSYNSQQAAEAAARNALATLVDANTYEFRDIKWSESTRIKGWKETAHIIDLKGARCPSNLKVTVAIKSLDASNAVHVSLAAPDNERTPNRFTLVVYTWGDESKLNWVEAAWAAYCERPQR